MGKLWFVALLGTAYALGGVASVEVSGHTVASGVERYSGDVRFTADPRASVNRGIVDLDLAPADARGLVEYSANFYVLSPADPAKRNGTALVEISNRGGKALLQTFDFAKGSLAPLSGEDLGDRFLLDRGFTLVWIGWEFDVPDEPGLMRLRAPLALDHGKPVEGLVRSEWTGNDLMRTISLGDRSQIGYPVANPNDSANVMYVRDRVDGPRTMVPRSQWNFAGARHVTLEGGFTPGRIYEIVYRAKDSVVSGLGFAAVRDFVSYLKYAPRSAAQPLAGFSRRAIGFGISQDGRFLRTYLAQGFNLGENGRAVFDGVWAHVGGGGQGNFNARFAQPSRDGHPFFNVLYPVDVPPFTPDELLAPERAAHVAPKLFLSNGSYEYWGRCASLIHTTRDGKQDVPPGDGIRIYFFAGSQHGPGSMPPRTVSGAQYPASGNDYRTAMRALLVAMQNWIAEDREPPASMFPLISAHKAVPVSALEFPAIPRVHPPAHPRQAYRLDFSIEPPRLGEPYPVLVPQVDDDGNETSGIRMPEIAVPLATNTGWNFRDASIGASDELYSMVGAWLRFPRNQDERSRTGDPRESIAERYSNKDDYLRQIEDASRELARRGYLLDGDLAALRDRASREWDYATAK